MTPEPRPLAALLRALDAELADDGNAAGRADRIPGPAADSAAAAGEGNPAIEHLTDDSRAVRPGSLFIAINGVEVDGHQHIEDAVRAGAVAVVTERDTPDVGVPVIRVPDGRRALAMLAAEWFGRPAERLRLIGVTGTVGKTTVVGMLEAILTRAGLRVGAVGSLGAGWADQKRNVGMTTPGPLELHAALARIAEHADLALVEVTSHALEQERVHGLRFELGIFTNLVMLEHQEFHESFQAYVAAKSRFFDHLAPDTPLIHPAGDRLLAQLVEERPVRAVSCGSGTDVALHIERTAMTPDGTRLLFQIERPYPRVDGNFVQPMTFPAALRLLGRAAVNNASLAAAAALSLGVDPETTAHALADLEPLPRRMQISRMGHLTVLDDTVGHPDSVTGVFEVAEVIPHQRLFVVYAIRGRRGGEINRRDAEAVAIWTRNIPVARIEVTASADAADDANTVQPEERDAFLAGLAESDAPHRFHERLEDALRAVLDAAGPDDLVMLLGAQGMNQGAEMARRMIDAR